MFKSGREIKEIKIDEVSLVHKPANKQPFLFWKQDGTLIEVKSDGTGKGTVIKINGEPLDNIVSFYFNFCPMDMDGRELATGEGISSSYTKIVESEDGFKRTETYNLYKGDIDMNKELLDLLKSFFANDKYELEKKEISEKALDALKGAVKMVNKYKDDFPDELKKAIGVLAEYAAAGYGYPEKKDVDNKDNTDVDKKITDVVNGLGTKFESAIKQVNDAMVAIKEDIKKATEQGQKVADDLKVLTERTSTIEKSTSDKKGIDGQDGKDKGDVEDKFPSIPI